MEKCYCYLVFVPKSFYKFVDKQKICITLEDIIAQAYIFFFGGFESVARTMCFMAHELAANKDVQQKLKNEIKEVNQKCNGKITYDILMEMKYLDMVLSGKQNIFFIILLAYPLK